MTATDKRAIVFLLADDGMKEVVRGFLGREQYHRSLGCGEFEFDSDLDILIAGTRDPGVYGTAHELLQAYEHSHERAVVIVDADWSGSPGADAIRDHISQRLAARWKEFAVIVIEPELEAWLMHENPHMAKVFRCPENYRQILGAAGFWPDGSAKPPRPKEALDYLRQRHKVRVFNAEFGKLARAMSVKECQDAAFLHLRNCLRAWFQGTS